jgi:hypothetical protein
MILTGYFSVKLGSGNLEAGAAAIKKPSQNQLLGMKDLTGNQEEARLVFNAIADESDVVGYLLVVARQDRPALG